MIAGPCVLDHNKVQSDFGREKSLTYAEKNGICSKYVYCAYLLFKDIKLQGGVCALVQQM